MLTEEITNVFINNLTEYLLKTDKVLLGFNLSYSHNRIDCELEYDYFDKTMNEVITVREFIMLNKS